MTVITRIAPSPTGNLHIGTARTALFSWLFARHHGGKFLLRIEDTDRERSTQASIEAIHKGMTWLGLDWDGEAFYQFARADRHREVAEQLLAEGKAYRCYCSPEELTEMREQAKKAGKPMRYDGRWRDRDPAKAPVGVDPVIRIKAPREGSITVHDQVQGDVTTSAEQLDDLVLLRSDGTPTYMLAVVVDDHDMGITHVIRGDDHLTNAARQSVIYHAMGWDVPVWAHIPLIHGPDGAKLSKRHGALGVEEYAKMGYLPEAMRNYLLRLGWGHGDDEIISTEQAIEWFSLEGIGKSPSRFDFKKLENLNGHYMREAEDDDLVALIVPLLEEKLGGTLNETAITRLVQGMDGLKQRAKTLPELADNALFYARPHPITLDEKAAKALEGDGMAILREITPELEALPEWNQDSTHALAKDYAERTERKLGKVAQPLRAALTGSTISPSVFEAMEVLGREESLARLKDCC